VPETPTDDEVQYASSDLVERAREQRERKRQALENEEMVFTEGMPGTRLDISQEDLAPLQDAIERGVGAARVSSPDQSDNVDYATVGQEPDYEYSSNPDQERNMGHRVFVQHVLPYWTGSDGYKTTSDIVDEFGNEVPVPGSSYGAGARAKRGVLEAITLTGYGGGGFQHDSISGRAASRYRQLDIDLYENILDSVNQSETGTGTVRLDPEQTFRDAFDYIGTQLQKSSPMRERFARAISNQESGGEIQSVQKARQLKQNFLANTIFNDSYSRMQEMAEYLFDPTEIAPRYRSALFERKNAGSSEIAAREEMTGKAINALPISEVIEMGFTPMILVAPYRLGAGNRVGRQEGYYMRSDGQAGLQSGNPGQLRIQQSNGLSSIVAFLEEEQGWTPFSQTEKERMGNPIMWAHVDGGSRNFGNRHGLQGAPSDVVLSYIGRPSRPASPERLVQAKRVGGVRSVYTEGFVVQQNESSEPVKEALAAAERVFEATQPEFNDKSTREYISSLFIAGVEGSDSNRDPQLNSDGSLIDITPGSESRRLRDSETGNVDLEAFGSGPTVLVEGWFSEFKNTVVPLTNNFTPEQRIEVVKAIDGIAQAGRQTAARIAIQNQNKTPYAQRQGLAQMHALLWDSYTLQHFADIIASEYKYAGERALEY
jgi:hypothetical protein